MAKQKSEKHEFLYNYARNGFDDELQRFRNIEDKASKLLSLLSIGIIAFTLLLRYQSAFLFPPNQIISYLACITIALTYLAFITSWSFLYRSLAFIEMPRLPLDEKFIKDFEPKDLATIHFALTKSCSNALVFARAGNEIKSSLLIKGHKDIGIAMWFLTSSVVLIVLAKFY
ncbi:hypothetical protein [Methylophaga sp.]|uniref:hypothetical protein n=1 Tax=Methylophaga sp. TaxID=2024840 RepID=UPI0025DC0B5B|nr:hypothetical protein [Methylophaga sp.]